MKQRRVRPKQGDVFAVPLGSGQFAYGCFLKSPLMAFYDVQSEIMLSVEEVTSRPIAFKVWVVCDAIRDGSWPVIGHAPINGNLAEEVWFAKQDMLTNQLFIYRHDSDGEEHPATFEQCQGLETAAVWQSAYIEDRLRDHFAGRKNKWVESVRIKTPE